VLILVVLRLSDRLRVLPSWIIVAKLFLWLYPTSVITQRRRQLVTLDVLHSECLRYHLWIYDER